MDKQVIVAEVEQVYRWLAEQMSEKTDSTQECTCCGKCCDFDQYGHRLFITTPEMIHFVHNIGQDDRHEMVNGVCPYMIQDKCSIHSYRFAGCRIFLCRGDDDLQSELSEGSLTMLKDICKRHSLPYRYQDLASTLRDVNDEDSWLSGLV